ncbi:hypothetical protein BS47DRAFT_1487074 [Hydnum rufescens UP504]|uniref:Uncharacterized protein n=1 Tax=Hydnum rufescens UP504 TaxID=1448309 RepID=A0A9P6ASG8_9AGAM|nr:hypothetical protein BS47DRAFT_1487074 [Hydnum rufescens UP504]
MESMAGSLELQPTDVHLLYLTLRQDTCLAPPDDLFLAAPFSAHICALPPAPKQRLMHRLALLIRLLVPQWRCDATVASPNLPPIVRCRSVPATVFFFPEKSFYHCMEEYSHDHEMDDLNLFQGLLILPVAVALALGFLSLIVRFLALGACLWDGSFSPQIEVRLTTWGPVKSGATQTHQTSNSVMEAFSGIL